MTPFFSVCVPAYNRARLLPELLDSILLQDFADYEIVICEDHSPERESIRAVVDEYRKRDTRRIRYFENGKNLGYDANIRKLVDCAEGEYVIFSGNDDLLAPGALSCLASGLRRHENVGVVLRTYATFKEAPEKIEEVFRYFGEERFFPAGPTTIATFFKRCVVLPGVTIRREAAAKVPRTDIFDGCALYQVYLVANILSEMNGLFLPQVVAYYRLGGIPDFGHSDAEKKAYYVPGEQTLESSLFMMRGFIEIAGRVEETRKVRILSAIVRDLSNYSYGFLKVHRSGSLKRFVEYVARLSVMGYGRHAMFWVYVVLLTVLGERGTGKLIAFIKRRLGRTPNIGRVYGGVSGWNG